MQIVRDNHFYRLKDIVGLNGIFPFGASTWWAGVKSGRYPKPIKLGPRITAWRGADLNALVASMSLAPQDSDQPRKARSQSSSKTQHSTPHPPKTFKGPSPPAANIKEEQK